MVRFGVVSAYPAKDWHSRRLVGACAALGRAEVLAPSSFGVRVGAGAATVTVAGRDAREWDVLLLPRALGPAGDPDFQCLAYRGAAELGVPLVNPVAALLAAEDKVRTSWLLARAGLPTPAVAAVQSVGEAREALAALGTAVVKPPWGSLGIGIVRLAAGDAGAARVLAAALA